MDGAIGGEIILRKRYLLCARRRVNNNGRLFGVWCSGWCGDVGGWCGDVGGWRGILCLLRCGLGSNRCILGKHALRLAKLPSERRAEQRKRLAASCRALQQSALFAIKRAHNLL